MDNKGQDHQSQIFHHGYEKWEEERSHQVPPWILIAQAGLRNVVASSGCLSRSVFIIFFVIYYFMISMFTFVRHQLNNLQQVEALRPFVEFARDYLDKTEAWFHMTHILIPSIVFSVMALLFYGSQLISKDKSVNALQVYFSKALDRTDYILGKFLSVGAITAMVTLVPSAIMILLGLVFTPDHGKFLMEAWYVPIVMGVYWLMLTVVLGSFILFFSSYFSKGYMAAIGFVGFLLLSTVVPQIVILLIGAREILSATNWIKSIHDLGESILLLELTAPKTAAWQIIGLVGISALFITMIFRNVRPVEVVK